MILVKLNCGGCGHQTEGQAALNTHLFQYYGTDDDMQFMLFFDTREELDAYVKQLETPSEKKEDDASLTALLGVKGILN